MQREIKKQKKGFYIWHTVGDSKVRPSHAEMEGTLRNWEESPIPGEEPKCRCWAVPVSEEEMEALFPDAIKPAPSPLDFIGGGLAVKQVVRIAPYLRGSRFRDVSWIRNIPRAKLQKKFKHAEEFGIKGNMNNKTLSQYRQALEDHVKSPDTKVIIRATNAVDMGNGCYKLLPTPWYDPEDEIWEFLPGSIVRIKKAKDFHGRDILLAYEKV